MGISIASLLIIRIRSYDVYNMQLMREEYEGWMRILCELSGI